MSLDMRKPKIVKDPKDGVWVCEVEIYDRWVDRDTDPTLEETCHYYAFGEGKSVKESYDAWYECRNALMEGNRRLPYNLEVI